MKHLTPKYVCMKVNGKEKRNKLTWVIVRQVGYIEGSYQDARSTKRKIMCKHCLHTCGILSFRYLTLRESAELIEACTILQA
jgi:hypothetical protein